MPIPFLVYWRMNAGIREIRLLILILILIHGFEIFLCPQLFHNFSIWDPRICFNVEIWSVTWHHIVYIWIYINYMPSYCYACMSTFFKSNYICTAIRCMKYTYMWANYCLILILILIRRKKVTTFTTLFSVVSSLCLEKGSINLLLSKEDLGLFIFYMAASQINE